MSAIGTLIELELLHLVRRRSLMTGLASCGFVVAVALLACQAGGAPQGRVLERAADLGVVRALALLLPLSFAGGAISDEVSARTLVYLTARPVSRAQIAFGKWLVAGAACAALLTATSLALHAACTLGDPGALASGFGAALRVGLSASLEALVCAGVCVAYGALVPQAGFALASFHVAWFEFALSFAPGRLRLLSMAHHALELAGLSRRGLASELVPTLSPVAHLAILLGAAGAWFALAAMVFSTREYRGSETA